MRRLANGDCEETRARLSAHLGGELSWLWRVRLIRHLSRCEACQALLRSLASVVEHLHALGREPLPSSASAADAVIGRIRREATEERT